MLLNNLNINFLIDIITVLLGILILCIHTIIFYKKVIVPNYNKTQTSHISLKERLFKISLIAGGAMVPYGEPLEPEDFDYEAPTTIVELTDAELNELLQILFQEIGDSNIITVELLESLGFYTDTVVSVLTALGYFIW